MKVKKTRAERRQHNREMQAKHDAEKKAKNERDNIKRDILTTLQIPTNHAGRELLSEFITERIMNGDGDGLEQIVTMLTGSELMNRAQQAETELANQKRRNKITKSAFKRLGLTIKDKMGTEVLSMVRELANDNLNADEIIERLKDDATVMKSCRLKKDKRLAFERQIDESISERKKTRVDMRDVHEYIAKKNGITNTYFPATRLPPEHKNGEAPPMHNGNISERRLSGVESIQKENPRQYGLPNLKVSSTSINKAGMSEAIKMVGGRITEFRAYLYHNRYTGLSADVLAHLFMAESEHGNNMVTPKPVSKLDNSLVHAVTDPARRIWTKEYKQEASFSPLPHPKREGSTISVVTRPDQTDFAAAVRRNCNDRCVITGASLRRRTEAAHLIEHHSGGLDHWSNGLLLRIDLHRLFDDNVLAICPETLTVHIDPVALTEDPDLQQFDGKPITGLSRPINQANLVTRWERYQNRLSRIKLAKRINTPNLKK